VCLFVSSKPTSFGLSRTHLHLSMVQKVICFVLFCNYEIHQTWGNLDCVLSLFGKLLMKKKGALTWFHGFWTCGVKVFECWIFLLLKIKLNHNWEFQRIWDVPLMLLKRSQGEGFNEIYFIKFGLKMREILNFKWFFITKNSNVVGLAMVVGKDILLWLDSLWEYIVA
jgi:hypothetical protein